MRNIKKIVEINGINTSDLKVLSKEEMDELQELGKRLVGVSTDRLKKLDIPETLVDEKGYLLDDASWDGVHLNASYCRTWLDYLLCHVVLPEDYNGEYDVPTGYHPGDVVMDGVTVYDFKPSN